MAFPSFSPILFRAACNGSMLYRKYEVGKEATVRSVTSHFEQKYGVLMTVLAVEMLGKKKREEETQQNTCGSSGKKPGRPITNDFKTQPIQVQRYT